ncbi:DUF4430 domain-containing protein [Tumebacillus sp. ITR2]|uniref:DUF4430 domain-containing protein n=1 Tax=Tumebacillus amylolyticus TaxID=2801339 RepID=A0ABS1J7E2_9BACL|nr:DUF4430 domain-containing protein [Tumebacillus amylolyticus]MBL0386137.1 DUF4430 domain-containing protein [Tumebacillus amylolyticus]
MKIARSLGLFVALALVGTACGKSSSDAQKPDALPQLEVQTPVVDDKKQEAEPKSQEQQATPSEKNASDTQASSESGKNPSASTANSARSGGNGKSSNGGTSGAGSSNGSSNGNSASNGTTSNSSGTNSQPSNNSTGATNGNFELSVTEYFGNNSVFNEPVAVSTEQSLLDTMRDHLDIETAYGGSFVNGINGTKSGYTSKSIFTRKKRDWFYYVNGSVSPVGADAVKPKPGDAIWWDYHDWSGDGSSTPSVVASYPHPFTTGYNGAQPGTTIYFSGDHVSDANRLANALRGFGAGNVSTAAYADGSVAHPSTNVIVLGTWSELGNQPTMQTLFGSPTHTGLYAKFSGDNVQLLTYQGKNTDQTGLGAILATGSNGGGGSTPTWLVIGATEAGLEQALDIMIARPGDLRGKVGVVVNGSNVLAVPVAQ